MPGPKKVDWAAVERAYVTENKSARALAVQFGLSNSTVSAKARTEDWDGKRLAYRNSVSQRSYEKVAESVANESAVIRTESVLAARAYVRKFIEDLRSGEIKTNAKDAVAMIQVLNGTLAPVDGEAKGDPTVIEVIDAPDNEFLRRLLATARERRGGAGAGGLGPNLLGDAPPTRPN